MNEGWIKVENFINHKVWAIRVYGHSLLADKY